MAAGAAAVSAYFLFFFRLGGTPLLDPDEPVYGQIAREMVRTGHWLTPHLAGRVWFDKPPLFYWASAVAMAVLGPTELAARLPSALAAVALAGIVFALGRRWFGRAAGWMAAGVLATSLQTIILGRAAVTDMLFALTLTATLGAFALWFEGKGSAIGWAALCGISLGLAALCKGPVAPVLFGATAVMFMLWERHAARLLRVDTLVVILCCLLVAGPWYGAMLALHRPELIGQFIDANNLKRFSRPEHAGSATPFYFVPVLLVGLFPWSFFLPNAVSSGRRSWAGRLLLAWSAVVFLFFSASSTKLVTYIYPLYPEAALLIGAVLAGWQPQTSSSKQSGSSPALIAGNRLSPSAGRLRSVTGATAGLGLLMAVGLILLAARQYPAALTGAMALGFILSIGSVWAVWWAVRGRSLLLPYGVMMAGAAAMLAGLVVPEVAPAVSLRELAVWEDATHRPLVAYRLKTPGYLFYAGRELPDAQEPADLEQRVRAVPGLAVAMSRRTLPEVEAATPDLGWRVIWRRGNRVVAEPVPREPGTGYTGVKDKSKIEWSHHDL
jgi:4-amino-4-deoxy-L-arabinose transferase-like glycosyltransferase